MRYAEDGRTDNVNATFVMFPTARYLGQCSVVAGTPRVPSAEFCNSMPLEIRPLMENPFHRAIYLTGPTASGKTAVGVELARILDAEIIALDSTTLYRGMDIGTAKPTLAERGGIPHHLIDVLGPWESASVSTYREWAHAAIADIESRGKRVLFVGGTPMYLKVLLRGLFSGPASRPVVAAGARARSRRTRRGGPSRPTRIARPRHSGAARPPRSAQSHSRT